MIASCCLSRLSHIIYISLLTDIIVPVPSCLVVNLKKNKTKILDVPAAYLVYSHIYQFRGHNLKLTTSVSVLSRRGCKLEGLEHRCANVKPLG